MKFLTKLEKSKEFWFLLLTCLIFFLLRLPSLFEPLWYGDEGIYEVIGIALNHGRLLYRDIWDNKPPLLYVLYAIFQGNQPIIKFVSLVAGIISVVLFYFLTKKLFNKQYIWFITTSIFTLLLATPILEGNIANAENFSMPIILGAALLLLNVDNKTFAKWIKEKFKFSNNILNTKYFILTTAGILLGIAFLFKVVAIFDLVAFTLFFIYTNSLPKGKVVSVKEKVISSLPLRKLLPLIIGFLIPFTFIIIFFSINGALGDFIHSAFLANVGYVNYDNQLIIPQGLLIFKLLLLIVVCFILLLKRDKLSSPTLFILLWLAFSIFNALFSQRPYTHYLLVLISSLCLFIGIVLQKAKTQSLYIGLFFLIMLYLLTNFSIYNKTFGYYQNFLDFLSTRKDLTAYRAFFDSATPRDYDLAEFLANHLQQHDHIFIWGNNAQLYVLTHTLPPGRYTVAYHITASESAIAETKIALQKTKPEFIVVMPNQESLPYSLIGYSQRLSFDNATIYERDF